MSKTHCSVPAKLILSGEHAVLYNSPALSLAIQLPTHCWSSYSPSQTAAVTIELVNYQQKHCFPFTQWKALAVDIETRFHLFEQQTASIQAVLSKPVDLILTILHHFNHLYGLKRGDWHFKIESESLIGRGLGSSAAVIIAVLKSLFLQQQIAINDDELLGLAQLIECRQHGRSSGIDPATLIHGGMLQYQTQRPIQHVAAHNLHGWLIDTGAPDSTTGHCVQYVKQHYAENKALWREFATTTHEITQAWLTDNGHDLKQAIRHNHQLLIQIGVVPPNVQNFIRTLETQYDASAKICGAGSVSGEHAGMLLCLSDVAPTELCQTYGYEIYPLRVEPTGAHCEVV